MTRARYAALIVVSLAVLGFHPACNFFFRCGCTMFGLAARCNIHAPATPHCPWCARPITALLSALVGAAAGWVAFALVRRRRDTVVPLVAAGLGGVFVGLFVAAAATRMITGYPRFLW